MAETRVLLALSIFTETGSVTGVNETMDSLLTLLHLDTANLWLRGLFQSGIITVFAFILFIFGNVIVTRVFHRISQIFEVSYDESLIPELRSLFRKVIGLIALTLIVESFPLHDKMVTWVESITYILILFYMLLGLFVVVDAAGNVLRKQAPEFSTLR